MPSDLILLIVLAPYPLLFLSYIPYLIFKPETDVDKLFVHKGDYTYDNVTNRLKGIEIYLQRKLPHYHKRYKFYRENCRKSRRPYHYFINKIDPGLQRLLLNNESQHVGAWKIADPFFKTIIIYTLSLVLFFDIAIISSFSLDMGLLSILLSGLLVIAISLGPLRLLLYTFDVFLSFLNALFTSLGIQNCHIAKANVAMRNLFSGLGNAAAGTAVTIGVAGAMLGSGGGGGFGGFGGGGFGGGGAGGSW